MKKLPLPKRLEYWKYQCAALSFHNAGEVAAFLIEHKHPPLNYQLLTSLYVLYGRPFRQRKPVRLSEDLVPAQYSEIHNYLITLRDKLFAHVDTDGRDKWSTKYLSKIILGYRDGGFKAGMAQLFSDGFQFDKVKELCDHLYDVCWEKSETILLDALDGTIPSDITYEVDLREGDRYLIKLREL
jgi:hypothetical protein